MTERLKTVVIIGGGRLGKTVEAGLLSRGVSVDLVGRGADIPVADVTYITVPDREIVNVVSKLTSRTIALHASGSTSLEVFGGRPRSGSMHPLMSFAGPNISIPQGEIPAAISGDIAAKSGCKWLAEQLSWTTFDFNGDRQLYHAAAVMAGNFASTLLAEAAKILGATGIDNQKAAALLAPLAIASINNCATHPIEKSLTGPVVRGDEKVIAQHRTALMEHPKLDCTTYDALLVATRQLLSQTSTTL